MKAARLGVVAFTVGVLGGAAFIAGGCANEQEKRGQLDRAVAGLGAAEDHEIRMALLDRQLGAGRGVRAHQRVALLQEFAGG